MKWSILANDKFKSSDAILKNVSNLPKLHSRYKSRSSAVSPYLYCRKFKLIVNINLKRTYSSLFRYTLRAFTIVFFFRSFSWLLWPVQATISGEAIALSSSPLFIYYYFINLIRLNDK